MAEIKYTKKEHIIHQQKANEEAFLAELANAIIPRQPTR